MKENLPVYVKCACIITRTGHRLPWVDEIRYLGIYLVRSFRFKCSLQHAKRAFYRAANGILGKVGRTASEEVILQLLNSKCMPILLYGFEACHITKSELSSLDFVVNRFFMKLFKTSSSNVVRECQEFFPLSYRVCWCLNVL